MIDKIPHDWVSSPYGHGEWACRYCKATNREIAVIGDPNHCPDRARLAVAETPRPRSDGGQR